MAWSAELRSGPTRSGLVGFGETSNGVTGQGMVLIESGLDSSGPLFSLASLFESLAVQIRFPLELRGI